MNSWKLPTLLNERADLNKDLLAFSSALRCIYRRMEELPEGRVHDIKTWDGTVAALGTLRMAISSIKTVISDYDELIADYVKDGGNNE